MDIEFIKECLIYNPDSGIFTWKHRPVEHFVSSKGYAIWNARYAGCRAGTEFQSNNKKCPTYKKRKISINNRPYSEHFLAWILFYGKDPDGPIDHIDGDATNNKISNLRIVSHSENHRNRKIQSNNRSGKQGVSRTSNGKWRARIKINGKEMHLGTFKTFEEAVGARHESESKNGFSKRHGAVRAC